MGCINYIAMLLLAHTMLASVAVSAPASAAIDSALADPSVLSVIPVDTSTPVPHRAREDLAQFTEQLATWDSTTTACTAPVPVGSEGWSCTAALMWNIAAVLAGVFRDKSATVRDANMHTHYYLAAEGRSVLSPLIGNYTQGGEPLRAASCNNPADPSCADIYYTNALHTDNVTLVHRVSSYNPAISHDSSKRDIVEPVLPATLHAVDRTKIMEHYYFIVLSVGEMHAFGWDGEFPRNIAELVGRDSNFALPGATCLDIVGTEGNCAGDTAAWGYVSNSIGDLIPNHPEMADWVYHCKDMVL